MIRVWSAACVFSVCVLVSTAAFAQPAPPEPSADTPPLNELLDRLDALQRRVESLERQLAAAAGTAAPVQAASSAPAPTPVDAMAVPAAAAAATPSPPTSSPAHAHDAVAQAGLMQAGVEQTQYPSLRIHGFLDVNFADTGGSAPAGFHMGQLVLHLASALGPKINVFAETSFAPRTPGAPNTVPTSYAADLERGFIRYDHSDAFKLSFGRFHTPLGYWNNAYHHGLYLQTTISRPQIIEFGSPFQPAHFIGVLAEGRLPGSRLGLGYSAGVGNGRASLLTRAGDAGDSNDHKAIIANLFARPEAFTPLEVGVSVYRDRVSPGVGPHLNEWITSAHVAWTRETPEVIAEVVNVRHTDRTTGLTLNNPAYYVQTGYRLPWQGELWKPYFRFENISPAGGSLFEALDMSVTTLGVRYDVADFAAFKGEYRRSRRRALEFGENGIFVQTSFTF